MKTGRYIIAAVIAISTLAVSGCAPSGAADGLFDDPNASVPGDKAKKQLPLVFDARTEQAGSNCSAGGIALLSGPDANRNGVLDAGEVTTTKYVCNGVDGANGLTSLIAVADEPTGTACPTGGKKYSTGLDNDANGTLDASEITSIQYICNGLPGKDGADGKNTLVVVLTLDPADGNCSNGGKGIYTGLDLDSDGLLEPGEVQQTSFVCNGVDGLNALTLQTPEAPGDNCGFGGTRIDSGLDSDADGLLDAEEVSQTAFVCDGAPGPTGAPGKSTLVNVTAEPAGDNCATGGARVDTGLDLDADNVLEPEEVTSTSFVCDGAQGPTGEPGSTGAFLQQTSFSFSACPDGGIRVDAGLDTNQNGQLDGAEITSTSYVCNAALPWSNGGIAVGDLHACANLSDGTVACWGRGLEGQLGDGHTSRHPFPSSDVSGLSKVVFVAAGGGHNCALTSDGRVQCWGSNNLGQLGDGTTNPRSIPVVALTPDTTGNVPLDGVVSVAGGERHTCALRTNGTVWCWGDNSEGQLGDGSTTSRSIASATVKILDARGRLSNLTGITSITAGAQHTCARLNTGRVSCWGSNTDGQLGNSSLGRSLIAVGVVTGASTKSLALTGAASVEAGMAHTCAALDDGTARCWGNNHSGQLGDGTTSSRGSASLDVSGVSSAHSLAAGAEHTCVALIDGGVRCWGRNNVGQLGIGSLVDSPTPVPVAGLGNEVASLAAGPRGNTTCARLFEGTAFCWGSDSEGQLGNDELLVNASSPVQVLSIE